MAAYMRPQVQMLQTMGHTLSRIESNMHTILNFSLSISVFSILHRLIVRSRIHSPVFMEMRKRTKSRWSSIQNCRQTPTSYLRRYKRVTTTCYAKQMQVNQLYYQQLCNKNICLSVIQQIMQLGWCASDTVIYVGWSVGWMLTKDIIVTSPHEL